MVILKEKKMRPVRQQSTYREGAMNFREASNLPAIARAAGISTNPKITSTVRQDTIYNTCVAMGLSVKINAMRNVVAYVSDMQTAGLVLSTIYQMFGVKGSMTLTWDGQGKLYWSPETPVEKAPILAYAKASGLPPPDPRKYLA